MQVKIHGRRSYEVRRHRYNKRLLNFRPYEVGDQVWAALHSRGRGRSRSLSDRWDGPLIVVEKLSDVIYVLCKPRGRKIYTLHYDCLKPFVARVPVLTQNHPPETLVSAPLQQPVQYVPGTI